MLNPIWYFAFVIPIGLGIAFGIISESGVAIKYETVVIFMAASWSIISFYAGCKIFSAWFHRMINRGEPPEPRDKYFEALNGSYDIKDRLKLLEKDAGRNIDRIYSMGKEAGYHDGAD
jgi:predicted outer membrane lipoprotein